MPVEKGHRLPTVAPVVDGRRPSVRGSAHGLALARPLVWGEGLHRTADQIETGFVLPAGTVTFLLSDIEGSTRLWEAHAEGMAQAVPAHYALLSDAVGRHGGVRPVEQGEGDSIVAAFSRASDAVAAAPRRAAGARRAGLAGWSGAAGSDRAAHGRGAAAR
jgi:class 3 adenylate cyclase